MKGFGDMDCETRIFGVLRRMNGVYIDIVITNDMNININIDIDNDNDMNITITINICLILFVKIKTSKNVS